MASAIETMNSDNRPAGSKPERDSKILGTSHKAGRRASSAVTSQNFERHARAATRNDSRTLGLSVRFMCS
jgi:hypothetical protein